MFFTSRRPFTEKEIKKEKASKEKIYMSVRKTEKDEWEPAVPLPEVINQPIRNVSDIAVTNDGQKLLVYFDDDGNGEIYESELKGKDWTAPVSLGFPINTEYHESSASYAPDGKTLYFVSNRKGGLGGRDIWMSTRTPDGKWTTPINLGEPINTPDDEEGVFIHPDGKTMFFSSKGHKGKGGYDVFVSVFDEGHWSDPVNLGEPVNGPGDDIFIVLTANGKKGYFSSAGNNNKDKDIYELEFIPNFKLKNTGPKLTLVKGIVIDADTKQPIGANLRITDNSKNEPVGDYKSNESTGNFLISLPSGKNYGLSVNAEGYMFHSENFNIPDTAQFKEYFIKVELKKLKEGTKVILKNIFFDYDKATLRPESYPELDRVVDLLKQNQNIKIEISGHTDSKGSDEYNLKLSQARAKSVVDYIISKGIDAKKIIAKGYGETQPIDTNDTEEGRQNNRRVEFKVLSVE
jgi:outer membrane protein OmpA-like peptidoglycan-associated protein